MSKVLFILFAAILMVVVNFNVLRQGISRRQGLFTILTTLCFLSMLMVGLAIATIGNTAFIIAISPILIAWGIVNLIFAKDAEHLYTFLRAKGREWRWVIPNLPQRENFLITGIAMIVLGVILGISFLGGNY